MLIAPPPSDHLESELHRLDVLVRADWQDTPIRLRPRRELCTIRLYRSDSQRAHPNNLHEP